MSACSPGRLEEIGFYPLSDERAEGASEQSPLQRGTRLEVDEIRPELLAKYPLLRYRVANFRSGRNVRGLGAGDPRQCALVLDDMAVMGDQHYPCIIYLREGGTPIGQIGSRMRAERAKWSREHDCQLDDICSKNCLDVCVDYNRRWREFHR